MALQGSGFINPILQFVDASGVPYASGTLTFYAASTTNLQSVYSDSALTVSLTNPVHLNAAGRTSTSSVGADTPVYLQSLPYDVILKDSTGSTIWGPITAAGSEWPGALISIPATLVVAANQDANVNTLSTDIQRASSGTHSLFTGTRFNQLTINNGASTISEAVTVYIVDAPTKGLVNYALKVASGATSLQALSATSFSASGAAVISGDIYSVAWTDYSATTTVVGWSAFTLKSVFYKEIGKLVYVQFRISGTSNATGSTFTIPFANNPDIRVDALMGNAIDNGSALSVPSQIEVDVSASTVNLYPTYNGGTWTNSGTKTVSGQFWYQKT